MKIVIIGGGISGMIAANNIKYQHPNFKVILVEKNNILGGRLYQENINEITINNGPSWYWMSDIINEVYKCIGIKNIYDLNKIDPQYKLIFEDKSDINIPNNIQEMRQLIYSLDPQCITKFDTFIQHNKYKYDICKNKFLKFDNISISEYLSIFTPYYIYKLDILKSYREIVNNITNNKKVRKILEWPCLFIGSNPNKISGLFTFLTYSMLVDGTSIPNKTGMIEIVNLLENNLNKLGVKILKNYSIYNFKYYNNTINKIVLIDPLFNDITINVDKVICSCDYYYIESILPNNFRSYPQLYWINQILCPSSIIFNIVLDIKIPNLIYHNLFFDYNIDEHLDKIYNSNTLPKNPLFYINITSKLFKEVPKNYENLFILIPSNNHMELSSDEQTKVYSNIISRISKYCKINIKDHIVYYNSFNNQDFSYRFCSYGNNSYGLGCDNYQYAFFRPKIKSRYITNLYYTGQMTSPGPGIPPCMISGLNVSNKVINDIKNENIINSLFTKILYSIITFINNIWIFITNMIVLITTIGINHNTINTICDNIKKEMNFIWFNKLYEYPTYN